MHDTGQYQHPSASAGNRSSTGSFILPTVTSSSNHTQQSHTNHNINHFNNHTITTDCPLVGHAIKATSTLRFFQWHKFLGGLILNLVANKGGRCHTDYSTRRVPNGLKICGSHLYPGLRHAQGGRRIGRLPRASTGHVCQRWASSYKIVWPENCGRLSNQVW